MPQPAVNEFSGIFICYRRSDCAPHAGRLFDSLVARFGEDKIFMDVDSIGPGENYRQVIENAISSCAILIAIIGNDWLSLADEKVPLLQNANDFVRLEIGIALQRNVWVIPVLVDDATMPNSDDLPQELKLLAGLNNIELRHRHWARDVEHLISYLQKILSNRQKKGDAAEATKGVGAAESDPMRLQPAARVTNWFRGPAGAKAGSEKDEITQRFARKIPIGIIAITIFVVLIVLGLTTMQLRREPRDNDNALPTPSPTVPPTELTVEENAARGRVLSIQRKYAEAEPYWRAAVDQDEFNAEYNNELGVALFFQKRYIEAEPFLRKAVALNSGNAQYKADVGNVLSGQAKYAEAEPFHREALRLMPNDAEQMNNVGIDLYFQKKYAEAEANFRRAVLWKPSNPEIFNNLGNVLYSQGKYAEAKIQYQEALKRDPNNATFQGNVNKVPPQ